jgi:S-adenosyl-L-methionine hydrolase (adenosine-forming)
MPKPILFLSDLGVRDEFVGVCHSVIASIAPGAPVIDLSHGVPPQDIQAGALTFRDCIAFAPQDSILLGVVDPGVGTDRKAVAVETASQRVLVGPDNGLLSLAWDAAGGPTRAFEIAAADVVLHPVSRVFHGRDVFAPAAAHLAAGRPLEDLGPELKTDELVTLTLPQADILTGEIRAHVLDVDRFGNVRLNVRPADLPAAGLEGSALKVATTDAEVRAARVSTYAEAAVGEYAAIEDAWGWITVIRFEANAAAELGVRPGDAVWLMTSDD